jgi:aerobic C4-dicarboxylate transport protein
MVATLVIARWEGKIDLAHARAVLDGRITPNLDTLDDEETAGEIPAREPAAALHRPLPAAVPAT